MRSSKIILLTSLATLGGYGLYTAFDSTSQISDRQEAMFTDATTCASNYDQDFCKRSEQDARKRFEDTAPRFATMDECRQQFGSCGNPSTGENIFLPLMAGFVVGRMLSGPPVVTPLSYGLAPNCQTSPMSDPCRRTGGSGGSYFYRGNTFYGSYAGTNTASLSRPSTPIIVNRAGNSFGGFSSVGSTSSSVGSVGSTSSVGASARGGFGASAAGHAGGGE